MNKNHPLVRAAALALAASMLVYAVFNAQACETPAGQGGEVQPVADSPKADPPTAPPTNDAASGDAGIADDAGGDAAADTGKDAAGAPMIDLKTKPMEVLPATKSGGFMRPDPTPVPQQQQANPKPK